MVQVHLGPLLGAWFARRAAPAEEPLVKKLVVAAIAAAGGLALWRKVQADKAEQELWAEATDPVTPAPDLR